MLYAHPIHMVQYSISLHICTVSEATMRHRHFVGYPTIVALICLLEHNVGRRAYAFSNQCYVVGMIPHRSKMKNLEIARADGSCGRSSTRVKAGSLIDFDGTADEPSEFDDLRFGGVARLYGTDGLEALRSSHAVLVGLGETHESRCSFPRSRVTYPEPPSCFSASAACSETPHHALT